MEQLSARHQLCWHVQGIVHFQQQASKEGLEECTFAVAVVVLAGGTSCEDHGMVTLGADGFIA